MKKTHLAILVLTLIWGSTWLAIKVGLGLMPPFSFAAMRFVIASSVLLPFALKTGRGRIGMNLPMVLFTGLLLIPVPYAITYWGAQYISSGLTAVLFSTLPIFVAVFSMFLLPEEKLSGLKGLGLALGFSGILIIYFDDIAVGDYHASLGVGAVLLGSITSSVGIVLVKRDSHRYNPIMLTAIHFLIGAVVLLPLAALTEEWSDVVFNRSSVLSLLFLSLCGSAFAFSLYYWLLTKMHVTKVSLLVYATPIIATYLGWVFLDEGITLQIALGTILVFGGIKLAS